MDTTHAALWLAIMVWIIIHLIIIPYEVYWTLKFYIHRNSYVIKKRYATLYLFDRILFWIATLLLYTNYALATADLSFLNLSEIHHIQHQALLVHNLIIQPLFWFSLLFPMIRLWLIYYMIRRNTAIIHNEWQSIIDPTIGTRNWWLSHRRTYGSWRWIRKYVIIIAIALYPIFTLPFFYGFDALLVIVTLLLILCPLIFLITILATLTPEIDTIGIRNELRFVIKMYIFGMTVFISFAFTVMLSRHAVIWFLSFCGYFLVLRVSFLFLTLKHTKGPLMLFQPIMDPRDHSESTMIQLAHRATYHQIETSDTMQSFSAQSTGSVQEMRNILSNGDLFDGFMTHLLGEYCSEALLSVIEFVQFKKRIRMEHQHRFHDNINGESQNHFILPETVPDSAIVHCREVNEIGDYHVMAKELVAKYITNGCNFQINISYDLRKLYSEEKINGSGIEQLEQLFDPCIENMTALMRNSFRRFLQSDCFALIQTYSPPPVTPAEIDSRCDRVFAP